MSLINNLLYAYKKLSDDVTCILVTGGFSQQPNCSYIAHNKNLGIGQWKIGFWWRIKL